MASGSEVSRSGIPFSEAILDSLRPCFKRMGGKACALPPPCPWVVLKVLQSYESLVGQQELSQRTYVPTSLVPMSLSSLQELGHFLLHLVGLR